MCRTYVNQARRSAATKVLIIAMAAWLLGGFPADSQTTSGTKLGGWLYWETPAGRLPAVGINVTLVRFYPRQSAATIATDSQGWYVFYDVPSSEYYLLITLPDGRKVQSVLISVQNSRELILDPMRLPK